MDKKHLVILESPNKVKKVQSYLGSDYFVCATKGHIRDLPKKEIGVDIKKDFCPTYEILPDKKEIVKKLQEHAKKSNIIYIMTDEDREGEGIAKHIIDILPKGCIIKRATTNSITKNAILDAIKNAGEINTPKVDSYECRRILDRVVGYKCSFTAKQATGGRSVGRVQSAGLRILAEREKEILGFVPKEYWNIEVELERKNGEKITAIIKVPKPIDINSEEVVKTIVDVLNKNKWVVSDYEIKEKSNKAYPPFTTSTMYQSGSSISGWGSKKTASLAQTLYEQGFVTYIRSDSTFIVPEFVDILRGSVVNKYGDTYLVHPINIFSNNASSQEAHEAIRVTDIALDSVPDTEQNNLYKMIWKRTVASQMSNMVQCTNSVEFKCSKYIFGTSGSKIIFDGWQKVWDYGNYSDNLIPEFTVGEEMKLVNVKTEKKFTSPPSRYTESSLTKELEKRGIGRPSTYASIPTTLYERGYIEQKKNTIYTTELGIRVSDFLVHADFCFVDLDFTKEMEENLDKIAHSDIKKLQVLTDFWKRLKSDLEKAKMDKIENSKTDHKCPKCDDGYLMKKFSKFGPFYACSNRTNKEAVCDYKCNIDKEGNPFEKQKAELEKSDFVCKNCGKNLVKRTSKKGWEYLGCEDWGKSENCKGFYDKDSGEEIIFKKKKFTKWGKKKKDDHDE